MFSWICYSPTYLLSYSSNSNLHPLSLPVTGRDAVLPLLASSLYKESGGEFETVFGCGFLFFCGFSVGGLQHASRPGGSSSPSPCQKPSHMPSLLLLLHLNLALKGSKTHCFLQTDLFSQMDEVLSQHLMSAMNTSK